MRNLIKKLFNQRSGNNSSNHYYDLDIWSDAGKQLVGLLPKGFMVFGELIGWTSTLAPIQKHYTYQVPEGLAHLYVYRVCTVNEDGYTVDMPYDQMGKWCEDNGLRVVPELWRGKINQFVPEHFTDIKYADSGFANAVQLSKDSPVDEGVVIRSLTDSKVMIKLKSPLFYQHETKLLDAGEEDLESQESDAT